MGRIAALFLLALVPLLPSPEPAESSVADDAAIRTLDRDMVAALNARDVDRYLGFLAEDAIWLPPSQPAVEGKAAIRKLVSELCRIRDYTVVHDPRRIMISHDGDLAYLYYEYEFTVKNADGTTVTEKGKDLSVFRKVGASWLLVIDMWNSNAPVGDGKP